MFNVCVSPFQAKATLALPLRLIISHNHHYQILSSSLPSPLTMLRRPRDHDAVRRCRLKMNAFGVTCFFQSRSIRLAGTTLP